VGCVPLSPSGTKLRYSRGRVLSREPVGWSANKKHVKETVTCHDAHINQNLFFPIAGTECLMTR